MYTFSGKLKTFSIILMVLGIVGIAYGFLTAPKTVEQVEVILSEQHHGGHGSHDAHAAPAHGEATAHATPAHGEADAAHKEHQKHLEHVLHQLQNKPWAAVYIGCIFSMLVALGVFTFNQIQYAASAGWSPVLFRVMEGLSAYLLPGSILFFLLLVASSSHLNHLFVWMADGVTEPGHANYDAIIAGKSAYLNIPSFLIRAVVFLAGWNIFRMLSRKNSLALDETGDLTYYKRNFKLAATYLVFFIVTESIMSWDWIMSIDAHWYSTLFGWYVFASFFVTAITVIALSTLYLKNKGVLEFVNTSHIHDLAKFMFGLSIFWTYLWFSQFMLMWYSNIPEEVTYFIFRIEEYNLPFFGMLVLNFVLPILLLVNTDFKRLSWIIVMAGTCIIVGHYLDFFNMIMPGTVGASWFIGAAEIGSVFFFGGLFIFVGFSAIAKAPLLAKNNPMIEESKHFHY
ncbi:quinol:cytochrome C oxidoreductase [Flavobacterium sp. xlx-214]|uniref:quinol:cytochrome C oxidoreductase n=1 Tax=unclassified Flavobacterium TaxID=196869 RepID=UPI0013D3D5CC|nr:MULTISPECIES: quinol:cytochrome C oxidoreductase [unclassified Flavobacterium]MBA5793838.1 quinol:cytochrome C oxidoreductase [Flavobacterium sp. xlx-221]QMI84860.1 quinol:cytochrome C oxidoreductase [Flavobacterium sp. xlx-214]